MATSDTNRRAFPRLGVYSGNAEITRVIGRGRRPSDRARIVNWSRSGLCLRVPSPRRKLLFLRCEPSLFIEDAVTCTLRLPPLYSDIAVDADVVRVERCKDDPDVLEVGLRFDAALPGDRIEQIARVLEPKPRTTSARIGVGHGGQSTEAHPERKSARLARKSARLEPKSARLERTGEQVASVPESRKSARLPREAAPASPAAKTSAKVAAAKAPAAKAPAGETTKLRRAGEPMALPGAEPGAPKPVTHSQRLRMGETESLQLRGSARQARQSGRLR